MPVIVPETIAVDLAAANGYLGPHLDLSGAIAEISSPDTNLVRTPASGGAVELEWMEPAPADGPLHQFVGQVAVTSTTGRRSVLAPTMLYETTHGVLLRVVFYTLTLAIADYGDATVLRWWLEPGGDDATLRADGLALLAAVHQPGELVIDAMGEPMFPARRVRTALHEFDPEIAAERPFLEHLATLEEWSGTRIPVPDQASSKETTDIARLVAMVNARRVPLRLDSTIEVTTVNELRPGVTATFRLPLRLMARALGIAIPMGSASLQVAARVTDVELISSGSYRSCCELLADEALRVSVHVEPPESRLRVLRRTLVAGAPLPPMTPMVIDQVMDARDRFETDEALAWAESEFGPLSSGLVDEMERWWRG